MDRPQRAWRVGTEFFDTYDKALASVRQTKKVKFYNEVFDEVSDSLRAFFTGELRDSEAHHDATSNVTRNLFVKFYIRGMKK